MMTIQSAAETKNLQRKSNKLSNMSGHRVLVVGLGVSGLWCVRWLAGQAANVTITEMKSQDQIDPVTLREVSDLEVNLEFGGHSQRVFDDADMIIVSPGVPHTSELFRRAASKGIPIIGELEFASRLIDTPLIAVTGTNGKSTVTVLMGAMLKNAGFDVFVGGNIGTPLMAYAAGDQNADYAVVEVSSFQLDTCETFDPHLSMILNVTPDHLDRYPNYEAYIQSKLRIFRCQKKGQFVILNDDDDRLVSVAPDGGATLLRYGMERKNGRHAFFENGQLYVVPELHKARSFSTKSFKLPGRHNKGNLLGVVLASMALGIHPKAIQKTIDEFKGLPHRLEWIARDKGIDFYNDSKATNVDAAVSALDSFHQPLILIAGGRDKGGDYMPLVRAAVGKVRKAVLIGESQKIMAKTFGDLVPFEFSASMEEAVTMAISRAEKGDAILLAPGCASFDMYSDYAHRGRVFAAAVKKRTSRG
jgi:UDP-N-acetylmuramoylalanine--D-glutamate ligase